MQQTNRILIASSLAVLLLSGLAGATTLQVSNQQAQGQNKPLSVKVWPGYGLNLSFIETGETIIKAWLDDPSRIAMDLDGVNAVASVVHLRRIESDPGVPLMSSQDGATLLTVITQSDRGRKLYQIRIVPAEGAPDYFAVNVGAAPGAKPRIAVPSAALPEQAIASDASSPPPPPQVSFQQVAAIPTLDPATLPVPGSTKLFAQIAPATELPPPPTNLPKPLSSISSDSLTKNRKDTPRYKAISPVAAKLPKPASKVAHRNQSIEDANAAVYGLMVAAKKGQIKRGSLTWYRVQSAITWLRRGRSRETAARLARVNLSVLEQTITLGQNRPGRQSGT